MSKSYLYAVATQSPNPNAQPLDGPAFAETEVPGPWTHDSAITWARVEGAKLPAGTRIVVWRWLDGPNRLPRQGGGAQHRAYVVGDDGIVRRTDR